MLSFTTEAKEKKEKPVRILVISLRYLGDVLLVTPLIHSLRLAYPHAQLDALVYNTTASILEGNPDLNHIITTPLRIRFLDYLALVKRLFRRYDKVFVTQTGDRPFIYGLYASSFRVSVVAPKGKTGWWKRYLLQHWVEFDDDHTHTVLQNLKLLGPLNIKPYYGLITPTSKENIADLIPVSGRGYAVLHIHPQWHYKRWSISGWIGIVHYLQSLGLDIIWSGSHSVEELDYISGIAAQIAQPTINLAGKVSIAQLADILKTAKLYIGPDTGITHLAAASGLPVVALFGPTNPVKWAPWPYGYSLNENPFRKVGSQLVNNVALVQGDGGCVPCHREGCEGHRQSYSRCLDTLAVNTVQAAIQKLLPSLINNCESY